VGQGLIEKNPAHGIRKPADGVKKRRLSDHEYRLLGQILDAKAADEQFKTTVQIIRCQSACNFGSDSISMKFADGIGLFSERNQHHAINFLISCLVPGGLIVESVTHLADVVLVTARAGIQVATCPLCRSPSRRVHSRYVRQVSDLPCSGWGVRLRVVARRFSCNTLHCRRRIFAERFDETVLRVRSRRTRRLDCIVHHLGLALGGRPAASFAKRLMLPVSNDTVLRVVRAQACPRTEPLNVVGIDDWAFRRNHSYGTIVCDLERRRIVTLLPDREMATVRAWLAGHPDIKVLSRDRGGGYGEAAARALPCTIQVADRWHLMENASAAFLSGLAE
jgi:transposase